MLCVMDTTSKKTVAPSEVVRDNRSTHPDLMTMLDIAELAGVSRTTVTKWRQRGLLPEPAFRLAARNRPLYDRKAVSEWLVRSGRLVPSSR